ncbi:hypothetical protein HY641_01990 [Candidatus Woesearchaeota archaeon]|nr:hypothetical protein [Candidatus Woesearchaeota archaeon]
MAAPINLGLLYNFNIIFPFLLVWILVYAVLGYTKALGNNKALHAMVALLLAFMAMFSPIAIRSIQIMAPFFVVLMVFLVFFMLAIMTIGIEETTVMAAVKKPENLFIIWWIAAFVLIIGFGSFFKAIAESGGVPGFAEGAGTPTTPGGEIPASGQEEDFFKTLFHPKVLGLVFVMLVALFTVNRLASSTS